MAVLYSNNFEAESNGALPGWTTQNGAGFVVTTTNSVQGVPVQGTKHFGTNSDGDAVRWESGGALTDQAIRIAQRWSSSASVGAFLRAQTSSGDRGVLMIAQESGGNLRGNILVRDGGTITQAQSAYSVPVSSGDLVHLEASAVGSAFELRIWTNSNARPSSPTLSHTSAFWTSGRVGLRQTSGGLNLACCDNLVITDAAGGEDFFYPSGGGYTISLANGVYSLTGRDVALTYIATPGSYTIGLNSGSYAVTGSSAFADYSMGLLAGTYSATGSNINLTVTGPQSYVITLDRGSYLLTGRAVNLIWSGGLPPGDYSMYTRLRALGYEGQIDNMFLKFLQDRGATSSNLTIAQVEFLNAVPVDPGQINERWLKYWRGLGHTGSYSDMWRQYWNNVL